MRGGRMDRAICWKQSMTIQFSNIPLPLILAGSVVVLFGSVELGRFLGDRVRTRGGENVTTLEAAVLGLSALMLSFTFSMATTRYQERRAALLSEVNSITTTALRARLLPAPHNKEVLALLRNYLQIRVYAASHDLTSASAQLDAAVARSDAIQEALWQQVKAITAEDKGRIPIVFLQSLNEMFDNQERRLFATTHHLPGVMLILLYCVAATATGLSGYNKGILGEPRRATVYVVGFLFCLILLVIQDFDRPLDGFITIDQGPIIKAQTDLSSITD
jgi:hypothetical protein